MNNTDNVVTGPQPRVPGRPPSHVRAIVLAVLGTLLALALGAGTALALTGHHAAALAAAPATSAPASASKAPVKAPVKIPVKKPRPAASATGNTHNGPTYNAPVTIINEAPQPGSSVYVPIVASAPYYVTTNQGVVQQYYDYLNAKDFSSAWAMGGQYIGGANYAAWADGYSTTSNIALSTWDYYPGYNAVGVTITATQTDGSVKTYSGSYTVNGGDITSASIVQDGSSSAGTSSGASSSGLAYAGQGPYGGVYANSVTSASFAVAVADAYAGGGGSDTESVYSTTTGQYYGMSYENVGNGTIEATGGNGVLVQFVYAG